MSIVRVPLTHGKYAYVDEADADRVEAYSWTVSVPLHRGVRYAYTAINHKTTALHRFIMNAPTGVQVDHANHDGLDNRRCNLRLCDQTLNNANARKRVTTQGYRGVSRASGIDRWSASIQAAGQSKSLGVYGLAEDAARAYDLASREIFGEFAFLNFPDDSGDAFVVPPIVNPDSLRTLTRPSVGGVRVGASGYRGVSFRSAIRRWTARFRYKGLNEFLGCYDTAEEAARAYDAKAYRVLGDAAWLNFDPHPVAVTRPVRILSTRNTSGYRGVSQRVNGRWQAILRASAIMRYLGMYATSQEAARAYDAAAYALLGEKAKLNYPEEYGDAASIVASPFE